MKLLIPWLLLQAWISCTFACWMPSICKFVSVALLSAGPSSSPWRARKRAKTAKVIAKTSKNISEFEREAPALVRCYAANVTTSKNSTLLSLSPTAAVALTGDSCTNLPRPAWAGIDHINLLPSLHVRFRSLWYCRIHQQIALFMFAAASFLSGIPSLGQTDAAVVSGVSCPLPALCLCF